MMSVSRSFRALQAVLAVSVLIPPNAAAQSTAATQGQWSSPFTTTVIPVGAAALPDGKVLIWSSYDRYTFSAGVSSQTLTAIFDPATGLSTERLVTETAHDMFCPGTSYLPDGRLLITGGDTAGRSSVYNPGTATWTDGGNLNLPRGYQGQVTLNDGRAFILGGSWSGASLGKNGESWWNNLWSYLPNALASVTLGPDPGGAAVADRHPWLFALGGGKVLHAGPSVNMNLYDLTVASGSTTSAGTRADDQFSQNGTAVMYDIGKILKAGGASSYSDATFPSTAGCYIINVNNGVNVTKTGSLTNPRALHNSVVLPSGEVMVIGGMPNPITFSDTNAILTAEIWNPTTGTWRDVAPISVPRNYHSTALLLPDGRVFSGGGGLCGQGCAANHFDVQLYSPAYLFNANGTPATRPAITQAPASANNGSTINVSTTGGTQFVLMRYAAVTHSVNSDQRRIPLAATQLSTGYYQLSIPSDGIATPGNYMLFALDSKGVPSIATTINVGPAPHPTIGISSPTNGQAFLGLASIPIATVVTDPLKVVTRVDYYNGVKLIGSSSTAPYSFTWQNVPAGSYTINATVVDSTGYTSTASVPIVVVAVGNTTTMGLGLTTWSGPAFALSCNVGEVLAGINGVADIYLDKVSPMCVSVASTGKWAGTPVAHGAAGGTSGTAFSKICPTDQAVSGYDGAGGYGVDRMQVYCKPLTATATVTGTATGLGASGGPGGAPIALISCPTPAPATGIFGIAGTYVGQFGLSCSIPPVQANRPPVLTLNSPANNSVYTAPASVVISANASDPDGNLAKVDYYQGSNLLGTSIAAPFTYNWNNVLAGTYLIRVIATDAAGLTAEVDANITVNSVAGRPPSVLQSLKGTPVPEPSKLASYVSNRAAAIALGKALFWDVQVSSDSKVACASCHFQAGADVRFKNQSNPGMNRVGLSSFAFSKTRSGAAASGPNYRMAGADFPQYELTNNTDPASAVAFSTTDVMGSQGVTNRTLSAVGTAPAPDTCSDVADPNFAAFRQSTPRNAPTVVNAVFNFRAFHDGRANHVFNGVDSFGPRNTSAVIYRGNPPVAQAIALENGALASQAVSVPVSANEMSCAGRTWPQVGRRLLKATPLAGQAVASTDSVLAAYAATGGRGLNTTYDAMVRAAFSPDLWTSATNVTIGSQSFTQEESNFALFFGLAVQMYEATLVSDDAPIDRYFGTYPSTSVANSAALTATQAQGLTLFTGKAGCVSCHAGPQLSNAGTPAFTAYANGVIADKMIQGDAKSGLYDFGFYNIGVRTTPQDIGTGGTDPFGNPLSFTGQAISGINKDGFTVTPCAFDTEPCVAINSATRAVVDGAFKVPTLRNVALTGPYFHDGSLATLDDVVQFYVRGSNAHASGAGDTTGYGANTSNLAGGIAKLELSAAEAAALVEFLKTGLTDDRVAFERAPFDHPELPLVEGTDTMLIPAVGSTGRSTPVTPFADLVAAGTLGYPVAGFSMGASSATVTAGASGTSTVTITPANGFNGAVTLAASNWPSGITASLGTNPATASSVVTIAVAGSVAAGSYSLSVNGTSGSLSGSTTIPLTVNAAAQPSFTLSASAATATAGASGTSTVTITTANGFNSAVTLAVSAWPTGITATFAANPATVSSTVTINIASTVAAGAYSLVVKGTSGALSASATIPLIVNAAAQPSFTLSASAATITAGASGTSTVTITPANGFNSAVTLAAFGWPTGVTAAFGTNPATVSSVLAINVASTVAAGSYNLTVNGTSGSLSASTSVALTVKASGSGTLPYGVSVSPSAGSGSANLFQNLSFSWASPTGQPTLDSGLILIQDSTVAAGTLAKACYLKVFSSGAVELSDDAGNLVLSNSYVGNTWASTLSNSQCKLNGPASSYVSVTNAGAAMQTTLNLEFLDVWAGKTLSISLGGTNTSYQTGTWTQLGTFAVTGAVQPGFTLSAAAAAVAAGSSGVTTVIIAPVNGFSGSVTLAAPAWPAGITAAFATNPATSSSLLTINVASTVAAGSYNLTLGGSSGSITGSTTIPLTVSAAGTGGTLPYGVSVAPGSGTVSASAYQNLSFTWASPAGQPALAWGFVLIQDASQPAGTLANACYLKVSNTGAVSLADDTGAQTYSNSYTGNSWASSLSNAHCNLNGPASGFVQVTNGGLTLQVTLNMKFAPAWAGKTISVSLQGTNTNYRTGALSQFATYTMTP